MNEADRAVAALARRQYGVFSRIQAHDAGLSEESMTRRVISGRWEELFRGVYRLPGTPITGRQRAMAAVLWGGRDSAISHTTAGRLLRLDAVRSGVLHVTVPSALGLRGDGVTVHRRPKLNAADVVIVDGIRCTSATRTIVDCAALLGDEELEHAFEQARRMGLTTAAALHQRAEKLCGRGRSGSARIRRLLDVQVPTSAAMESRLEVKLARLVRSSTLPEPERQYRVGRFRLDFAWPRSRIACECDGFEHHGARLAWKRDRGRMAALEAAGWRIVQVTWTDVTREPGQTLDRLAFALRTERPSSVG
jgi:very-short-patch-repair endonuclease